MLITDCPRCGTSEITFDVGGQKFIGQDFGWADIYEIFCICRRCQRSTIFIVRLDDHHRAPHRLNGLISSDGTLNNLFSVLSYVSVKDNLAARPPEHIPTDIEAAFKEGATCLSVKCHNAAAAMFRLCIDLATKPLLPDRTAEGTNQPNEKQRRDLGLRLQWLFAHQLLPPTLEELASCIREDGNDGAHAGTITEAEAGDLLDFTTTLLERLFTEPKKLELAQERRAARRSQQAA